MDLPIAQKTPALRNFDNPRQNAIAAMRSSLPAEQWHQNEGYVQSLLDSVANHSVVRHPAIALMSSGAFDQNKMRLIHLEYRHAIVQIFTDALLAAQLQSRQLEPRLAPAAKMASRFLLTLNVLDEFGFQPGLDSEGYYSGNPAYAHYPLFEDVLNQYGVSAQDRLDYVPSAIAQAVRDFLEGSYASYINVIALLAVAEQEVILFTPALRKATEHLGLSVRSGYYYVHGVSDDHNIQAADDDHEDDLWIALTQSITPAGYDSLRALCLNYCDLWVAFWNEQIELI